MLGMWDVGDVGCLCDLGEVECSGCGMLVMWDGGMWDFGDVGCWGRGMLGM